jgi:aspartate carbamoyltransferase catalytic subunit
MSERGCLFYGHILLWYYMLYMPHVLTSRQFSKEEAERILLRAKEMEAQCAAGKVEKLLADKIIACIFFEPSTRTRLSFEAAAIRLGANVISAEDAASNSSSHKGETIEDTARIVASYADAIVIRHYEPGAAQAAASVIAKPVLNGGDGAHEHPTQALLDLYTIQKEHGRLDNLTIAFVGDLKNSRTLHSLLPLLVEYPGNAFYFVSPKELRVSEEYLSDLKDKGLEYFETEDLDGTLPKADIVYMTRVQKERFETEASYESVKDALLLNPDHLKVMKSDAIIMHPLPRVNEIDHIIDEDDRAAYFRQAQNGLYIRMALLLYVFGL